uniref:Uncharacterized protein n=1 Tax=Ixodes ricinus TaxID=34613 RepID=A0A6B0UUB3_IXORI
MPSSSTAGTPGAAGVVVGVVAAGTPPLLLTVRSPTAVGMTSGVSIMGRSSSTAARYLQKRPSSASSFSSSTLAAACFDFFLLCPVALATTSPTCTLYMKVGAWTAPSTESSLYSGVRQLRAHSSCRMLMGVFWFTEAAEESIVP